MDGLKIGSVLLSEIRPFDSNPQFNQQIGGGASRRQLASNFGLNNTIQIKCKNMKAYDLAFALNKSMQLL